MFLSSHASLPVLQSTSELSITNHDGVVSLQAPGLLSELKHFDCTSSGAVQLYSQMHGSNGQTAVMHKGRYEPDHPIAIFSSADAADACIAEIGGLIQQSRKATAAEKMKGDRLSARRAISTLIETVCTGVVLCLLGAAAANLGWTAAQPAAAKIQSIWPTAADQSAAAD